MARPRTKGSTLPERVYLERGEFIYRPRDGKRVKLGTTRTAAILAHAKLLQQQGRVVVPQENTISAGIDKYLVEELPLKAPSDQRNIIRHLDHLRAYFGQMYAADLKPSDVYGYQLARAKVAPVQANREKARLSHLFTKMVEWGMVERNPIAYQVKRLPERPRTRVPSIEELSAFCAVAQPIVGLFVEFKLATGLRKADILALPRIRVDAEHFDVEIGKSRRLNRATGAREGQRVRYPLTPQLRGVLERLYALPGRPDIGKGLFVNREGERYTTDGFDCLLKTAFARWKKQGGIHFHEHDIRATVGTLDPVNAKARLGHKKQSTTDLYLRSFDVPVAAPLAFTLVKAG